MLRSTLLILMAVSLSGCMTTYETHTHYHYENTYPVVKQCRWQLYDPRITQWANEQLRNQYTPAELTRMGFENKWTCVENH